MPAKSRPPAFGRGSRACCAAGPGLERYSKRGQSVDLGPAPDPNLPQGLRGRRAAQAGKRAAKGACSSRLKLDRTPGHTAIGVVSTAHLAEGPRPVAVNRPGIGGERSTGRAGSGDFDLEQGLPTAGSLCGRVAVELGYDEALVAPDIGGADLCCWYLAVRTVRTDPALRAALRNIALGPPGRRARRHGVDATAVSLAEEPRPASPMTRRARGPCSRRSRAPRDYTRSRGYGGG